MNLKNIVSLLLIVYLSKNSVDGESFEDLAKTILGTKSDVGNNQIVEPSDSTSKKGTSSGEKQNDSRRIGPVVSPFFFLCHRPRQGEPPERLQDDVTLRLDVTGERNFTSGYEPQTVYEVLVTSSVQLDAFILTAVHSLTKKFTKTNHLHLPSSSSNENSAGSVCTILHSHISKRPKSKVSFLWMTPPSGAGCVAMLATGSLHGRLLFKDIKLKEICEKEDTSSGELKIKPSLTSFKNDDFGFIFKDDFEEQTLNKLIWDSVSGGKIEPLKYFQYPERAIVFSGNYSSIQTNPMDLSKAKQLQYTLGTGDCEKSSKIRLSFGFNSVNPSQSASREPALTRSAASDMDRLIVPTIVDNNGKKNTDSPVEIGSGIHGKQESPLNDQSTDASVSASGNQETDFEDNIGMGEISVDDLLKREKHNGDSTKDNFDVGTPLLNVMAGDQPQQPVGCDTWEEVDEIRLNDMTEVHTRNIPIRFRRKEACIKWERIQEESKDKTDKGGRDCWLLDNVAVVTKTSHDGPISDDFDPVDPVNWLFFPGGQIKENCNSEGNALVFEGVEESWVTTRQIDFSDEPDSKDFVLEADFLKESELNGFEANGGRWALCPERPQKLLSFNEGQERTLCSSVDCSNVGVVKLEAGVNECTGGDSVDLQFTIDINGEKTVIETLHLDGTQEIRAVVLPSEFQQKDLRVCVEQSNPEGGNFASWVVHKIQFLPWMPSKPKYFFQAQMNLKCGYTEGQIGVDASSDAGRNWRSIHSRCVPGRCHGEPLALSNRIASGLSSGWDLVTIPLPNFALIPNTKIRVRQLEPGNDIWMPRWAMDNVFIGKCPYGCNNRGLCQPDGACKCQYGFTGKSCENPEILNPLYISEPFTENVISSANILKVSGGKNSYLCGVIGRGPAAVFKGSGERFLTTVDVNTTEASFLQFHFQAGTLSQIGKCPGPNDDNESIYVHYSCSGGAHWTLLHTLHAKEHKSPSFISLPLPAAAKDVACRFQIWQAEHSGSDKDMWSIDDFTVTSQQFNIIELSFDDIKDANYSLRFHLGRISQFCEKEHTMVFDGSSSNGLVRFLETKSINIGPSYMMQFDLVIGCESPDIIKELDSTVVLEYSLNHGLRWQLVQRPCSPSKPGCESHFTRGTVYHISEFNSWKRVTLILPRHTWSPTTRLRLRQLESSDTGLLWSIDNLYIGHRCDGLCSGHGHCTSKGCRCDDNFHGYKCLPLHKLLKEIDVDFDGDDDLLKYSLQVIGGSMVARSEGCGTIVSGKSIYFGSPGVRHFETDDLNAENLDSIMFHLVIGSSHGNLKSCLPASGITSEDEEELSYGSVVLEFSVDGGITWELMKELLPTSYRKAKQFQMDLQEDVLEKAAVESGVIRFRIWQPKHALEDQWAIDDFKVKSKSTHGMMSAPLMDNSTKLIPWLSATQHTQQTYCDSKDKAQVMDSTDPLRMAVTNQMALSEEDVITFKISVGCKSRNIEASPVRFEYSRDVGHSWHLVQEECHSLSPYCKRPLEPSVYWPGHHSQWTQVYLPVDHKLSQGTIQLRWMQENTGETRTGEFGLKDFYIGPPCFKQCHGHGLCSSGGACECDDGFSGKYCGVANTTNAAWLRDDFNTAKRSPYWDRIEGAEISAGCGKRHHGNVLLFSGDGPRFITTKELDTRRIKYLVFNLQIGRNSWESSCKQGIAPRDNVILEQSSNNGLTWNLLREFEPYHTIQNDKPFFIPLPLSAKTKQTRFRWWQIPHSLYGSSEDSEEQAEWQLDNVMVLANETLLSSFDEGFHNISDQWFIVVGGHLEKSWNGKEDVLAFSGHNAPNYAETWDFDASSVSVVQFDLLISSKERRTTSEIHLEYSADSGKSWQLIRDLCVPPEINCDGNHLPSIYSSKIISNWTRITIPLPRNTDGERVRLRLTQTGENGGSVDPASNWGLSNFFLGDSCPWMCSGHGYCSIGNCSCDQDYFGKFCVPSKVLPCEAIDNFDSGRYDSNVWGEVHGAEVSNRCGAVVSKFALVFYKDDYRYATTVDLDMTSGRFVQFNLKMGCKKYDQKRRKHIKRRTKRTSVEESDTGGGDILVQYSNNGGITWTLLEDLSYLEQTDPIFISISLDSFPDAKSNATRFRIWQPTPSESIWAIDSLFIGGLSVQPNVLFDDFNGKGPHRDGWVDWPSAEITHFCDKYDSRSSLAFGPIDGEHALYSRDLFVDKGSVLQFDIKVGCGNATIENHNVSLRYSLDFGQTWSTLRSPCSPDDPKMRCLHELQTPSVYYPNAAIGWERITIPLSCLPVCGNVRFSWWQGYYLPKEASEPWAIDNVYIGPSCTHHCYGRGYCINGDSCDCDYDFDMGETCLNTIQRKQEVRQDFEDGDLSLFERCSGSDISEHCHVISGSSLLFWRQGERMLVTTDLNLSDGSVVQFYLREGCANPYDESESGEEGADILLQFTTNGGLYWVDLAKVSWDKNSLKGLPKSRFFSFYIPESAKTNATRLRWWQPSENGTFKSQWAIDQIFISSYGLSLSSFYDDGSGTPWLLRPGSKIDTICDGPSEGVHFANGEGVRFVETPDIKPNGKTFIQFELAMGCKESGHCYDVSLEYSINHGHSWQLVKDSCLPNDINCPDYWHPSAFTSDLYTTLSQVTLSIPIRARSQITRFRFVQKSPFKPQHTWALGKVYIGGACPNRCDGRGLCADGQCECQAGWSGSDCSKHSSQLPKHLLDDFDSTVTEMWERIVGGKVSSICGPIASKQALHFYGGCSRLLETVDMDLRQSLFIQFDIKTDCFQQERNNSDPLDKTLLVQMSCNGGSRWNTVKKLRLDYVEPKYIWIKIPTRFRCLGGRVRWWQPGIDLSPNENDWAIDAVAVGGNVDPPTSITLLNPKDLVSPFWLRGYNSHPGTYCNWNQSVLILESTPSEAAIVQTTDVQITVNHSIHFDLALGCGALWDNTIEPVSLQYSNDFGRSWTLLRDLCLPFNSSSCKELHDESVFYAPQLWNYYVFPLDQIGPLKYARFRWIQNSSPDISGSHKWSLKDVFIGLSCPHHCLGRGSCLDGVCHCEKGYDGEYCQEITIGNVPYIKDTFEGPNILHHWRHIQGALLGPGCGGEFEEAPAVSFQGPHTRALVSRPVDTRSGRFVLFTAHIGSNFGHGLCRRPIERMHNVFLQYSRNGGIHWHLLRELDHKIYRTPTEDYILLPRKAMSPATIFRFWQPRLVPSSPAWSLDNVFIGGSEIPTAQFSDAFIEEPTVSEWLFAPHSHMKKDYCEVGRNASLVWEANDPGRRAITTQELIVTEGHVLHFKISVGCQEPNTDCYIGPKVHLEYSKDGGATGWELVMDSCFPETSADPDCFPYAFHGKSIYGPDLYSSWTRITIPLPEKTWSSTTQIRWIQNADLENGQVERVFPWSLDDVYMGEACKDHCNGHGDCVEGRCVCDIGYEGDSCLPNSVQSTPLPSSLIDGFEGAIASNWERVSGGGLGMGCNSLAPYGHGKHLYFSGCGIRQAVTRDLDTRGATKVMFVLRIGSHDGTRSCRVDLSDPLRVGDKGVVLQYSTNKGIIWHTINVHDPLDFRKAKRVAYSLPEAARQLGTQLRWWQPDHDDMGTDQWAIDNVEIVLGQRKSTDQFEARVYHQ